MSRRVIRVDKALMHLFQLGGGLREGKLLVEEAPLDVKVCLHEILVALTLRADNRLMVDRQPLTDGFERVGGERPTTIRDEGLGGAVP